MSSTTPNIFFNCSMPRAMSTLLQNVLAQNPAIHASGTDPSFEFIYGARANLSGDDAKSMDQEVLVKGYRAFCREGLKAYAAVLADGKENICIKHRGITAHYDIISNIMGQNVKVIQMIRDARSIFSSYEKIFRASQDKPNALVNHAKMQGTSTSKRVDIWAESPPIGLAFERLKQVILEGNDKNILFVRAEDLCKNPKDTMDVVYKYLELPSYSHDFNNVVQLVKEDDAAYGMDVRLHDIRQKIEYPKPDYREILGKDVADGLNKYYSWYQDKFAYS